LYEKEIYQQYFVIGLRIVYKFSITFRTFEAKYFSSFQLK